MRSLALALLLCTAAQAQEIVAYKDSSAGAWNHISDKTWLEKLHLTIEDAKARFAWYYGFISDDCRSWERGGDIQDVTPELLAICTAADPPWLTECGEEPPPDPGDSQIVLVTGVSTEYVYTWAVEYTGAPVEDPASYEFIGYSDPQPVVESVTVTGAHTATVVARRDREYGTEQVRIKDEGGD